MPDPDLLPDLVAYQSKDPQLALDAALAAVRSFCGWHIVPSVTETVNVWSPDGRSVFVQTLNLTSITSVVQDAVTIASSAYTFESYGVITMAQGGYFSTLTRVAVNFTHGYATLPTNAKDVVLSVANRSISDSRGMVARPGSQAGIFVETYGPRLTDDDKFKLRDLVISTGFA